MSAPLLRFEVGEGAAVVELDAAELGSLAAGDDESPWRVTTAPDWERFDTLRLLAARFADGTIAALIGLRPVGARGHDTDQLAAVLVDRGESVENAHEALLSTETDADGRTRRVGLELWTSDEPPPRRLAADRAHSTVAGSDGVEREAAVMEARLDGETGTALFEVLRPA